MLNQGNPSLTSKVNILINVLDVNEFPPEISVPYETAVCENAKPGQKFTKIPQHTAQVNNAVTTYFIKTETFLRTKDNTAGIEARRNGYSRRQQELYFLPVIIEDSSYPVQSSTNTMTIRVCRCDSDGTILSSIVVLYVALRRQKKKDTLMTSKEDIRDNVIHYDDEGGGEEDTQAFDIGALRNPKAIEENKIRRDIKPDSLCLPRQRPPVEDNTDIRDFIHQRLQENDVDPTAPPYDSLATYAYEGSGSVAESLSSIDSLTTEADQDYDYLTDWGPRFKVLADMFGEEESYNSDKVT
ncbi:Cadherin-12 [Saguinus oedipus]|uniref:Cadherin-12 n=1 Tax=Saguinus oedipus TaxID=9490 RepID=A0ABQ9W7T0_SAGOE|nr:Cadherin-12 [Saguinus oedipus]